MSQPTAPKTVDQLRNDIDHGRTGDKVDFPDPAAAPLGTDAEAGGHPPTRAELAKDASAVPEAPRRRGDPGVAVYGLSVGVVAIVLLAVVGLTG